MVCCLAMFYSGFSPNQKMETFCNVKHIIMHVNVKVTKVARYRTSVHGGKKNDEDFLCGVTQAIQLPSPYKFYVWVVDLHVGYRLLQIQIQCYE